MSKRFALTLPEESKVVLNGLSQDGAAYAWTPSGKIEISCDSIAVNGDSASADEVGYVGWLDVSMAFTDAETEPAADGSISGPVKANALTIQGKKDGEPIAAELAGAVSMEITGSAVLDTGNSKKGIAPNKDSLENAFDVTVDKKDGSVTLAGLSERPFELLIYSAANGWTSATAKKVTIRKPDGGNYRNYTVCENHRVMITGKNLAPQKENDAISISGDKISLDFVKIEESSTELILSNFEAAPASGFWGWPAACLAVALLLGASAFVLARILKRRRAKTESQETLNPAAPYEHTSKIANPPPQHPAQPQNFSITIGTLHEIGQRPSQQDSIEAIPLQDGALAALADGMGGLADGDKVSQLIMRTIRNDAANASAARLSDNLLSLALHANAEVNQMLGVGAAPEKYRSGSTLILAVMEYGQFRYVAVGDSRIYLFRAGGLIQLNREHVYENELLQRAVNREIAFADALSHPKRKSVTSFIGMGSLRHVDFCSRPVKLLPGDKLLLCSDGVFNALSEERIASVLASDSDPNAVAAEIKRRVLEKNIPQQDNFSAVLAFYG